MRSLTKYMFVCGAGAFLSAVSLQAITQPSSDRFEAVDKKPTSITEGHSRVATQNVHFANLNMGIPGVPATVAALLLLAPFAASSALVLRRRRA